MKTPIPVEYPRKHRDAPRGNAMRRLGNAIRRALPDVLSIRFGHQSGSRRFSPTAKREITAIDTYARFLSMHPDIPSDHRAHILRQILRSCEELHVRTS